MNKKWKSFLNEGVKVKVRGYIRPADQFHTLGVWEKSIKQMLSLQAKGMSVRGGKITTDPKQPTASKRWLDLIDYLFGYLLEVETGRFILTEKNVLDFIEDFINHRFWSIRKQYEDYFPDIDLLKFGFLYSRGDIEPYVMIDEEFTEQFYGSTDNIKTVKHFTTGKGLANIVKSIENNEDFDISTFTIVASPFFRDESNVIVTLEANVRAAFRSDVKSLALDNGRRAANLHRLDYPGDETNICPNLDLCDGELKTSLWNEIIATPVKISEVDAPDDAALPVLQEVEKYQKQVAKKHSKMKRRLIGLGGAKNVSPYTKKPSFKRSKSAPGPFAGS
tara:strand:+ start:1558 stop:2559 length:1002 start_codon:yes stop_codon:yes gene_type:complete